MTHREMYRNVTPRPISNIETFKMVLGGTSSPVSFSAYQNQCAEEWRHVKETPRQLSKTFLLNDHFSNVKSV